MDNKIKYIVSDLDGTILNSTLKGISNETVKIINEFQEYSNYKFTFATGRHINMTNEYLRDLNIKLPIITCNGALIYDHKNNKIISEKTINNDYFKDIIKKLKQENIDVVVYTTKNIYGEKKSKRIVSIKKFNSGKKENLHIKYKELDDILEIADIKEGVLKLLLTIENKNKDIAVIKKIANLYPELYISASRDDLYDVNHKDATKGKALKILCDYLKISTDNVLVYGDNENDLDLFKESGYCVAPSNAIEGIKKIASEIIGSVEENSVSHHIKKHFLNKG